MSDAIAAADPFVRHRAQVNGRSIGYVDEGAGRAAIMLHGNPTSSYLYRNITPTLRPSHGVSSRT
jgi:haloalkane dehalogenase